MTNNLINAIRDLLDPYQISVEDTSRFVGVPHDEILEAYEYWLQYLKLLIKEPFTIQIIQGLQDEGVDLILEFLKSDKKIGLQVKSHNDLKDKKFREKIMAQIAYSKKHGLEKLFVILCADLQNNSQSSKTRNMTSQVSQMQDDYVLIILPQQAYPIYECYKNKKHPLVYLARNKQTIDLIHGLAESLSTEDCKAEISVKFNYVLQDNVNETHPLSLKLKFNPFQKDQKNNPLDKLAKLQLNEKIEFTKDDINEIILNYPNGRKKTIKPDYLKAIPEKQSIGPINLYPVNSDDVLVKNIILYKEQQDQNSVTWKTDEEFRPWCFELVVLSDKKMINFRFDLDGKKSNYKDILNYLKIMRAIKQHGKIILEVVPLNSKQEISTHPSKVTEVSDEEITMVENIIYIQERLAQQIPVTDEYLNPILIQMTKDLLEEGKIEVPPQQLKLPYKKYYALDLITNLKKQSPIEKYEVTLLQMLVSIGGTLLKLPSTKITMKNVVLVENINELERQISSLQNDKIVKLTLKPATNENIVYEITE